MSIRLHNHWIEECKGTQLSLGYDKGKGFKAYLTPCHRRSPDPKEGALLDIMEGKSQMLLPCKRTSAKVEAEAIKLFEQLVQDHIKSNPIIVSEKLVINVGDRFFDKASNFHWDEDKIIVITSITGGRHFGLSDVAIRNGKFETFSYDYSEMLTWDRLEPMSEPDLQCLANRKIEYENELKALNDERERLMEVGRSLIPKWAVAAIVAQLEEDTSDGQADYHGRITKDYRVLAFSQTTKNDFKAMHKAASEWDQTAHLANPNCENRENFSMGNGYYLANSRYSGWQVSKSVHLGNSEILYALGKHGGLTKGIEPVETVEMPLNPEPISEPVETVEAVTEEEGKPIGERYEIGRFSLISVGEYGAKVSKLPIEGIPEIPFIPEHIFIDGIKIDRNREKDCIEIAFSENPASQNCEKLIQFGFRRVNPLFWCNNSYSIELFDAVRDSLTAE